MSSQVRRRSFGDWAWLSVATSILLLALCLHYKRASNEAQERTRTLERELQEEREHTRVSGGSIPQNGQAIHITVDGLVGHNKADSQCNLSKGGTLTITGEYVGYLSKATYQRPGNTQQCNECPNGFVAFDPMHLSMLEDEQKENQKALQRIFNK